MADESVPAWKFWHPLPWWKMLLIIAMLQVVCQFGVAMTFFVLGYDGTWGGSLGAGLGGGLGALVVQKLAKRTKAAEASSESD